MHVVATAGHVDHGKSTLVRALTGMEPDRWAEERRRGMTIDLGFAWTTLPSGAQLSFVDVPGHQRFIANMLAGIGPAAAVLFVVAADEGWCRQSEEHLAALDALDVQHGLLAVTRSDLADPAPALAEAQARMATSSLGEIDAVTVSGQTGQGIEQLRDALDHLVAGLPAPDAGARVRLWIDRSFTVRGAGTVVTGTLAAGSVACGAELELRGTSVIVRGLQVMTAEQDRVDAVARVALNLRGLPRADIGRGDALLTPRSWHLTSAIDVRVDNAARLPAELMLHVGTAAVPVRVRPLGELLVRLTLAQALPLQAGDRAVLRDPGRQTVAAGVLVLDADPPPLTRRGAARTRAADLRTATGHPDAQTEIERRGAVRRDHLERLGVPLDRLDEVHQVGGWLIAAQTWDSWLARAPQLVDDWAERNPLDPAVPIPVLQRELGLPPDPPVAAAVVEAAGLRSVDGRVSRPGVVADLDRGAAGVRTLVERLRAEPFAAPERYELDALRLGPRELAAAHKAGVLLRISADIVLLPDAPEQALTRLRTLPQPFTASAARQALGTTRRVVIPLLEHLDEQGSTERIDGGARRIRP
ncbi:MAG: selenocysteine-specific elongation factor [Pseudonocardiales bacterium]|nr:selenocysteine-specific elongation factor [Pseudonocardiales bacterium]